MRKKPKKTTTKRKRSTAIKPVVYRQRPEILLGELSGLKGQFKPNLVPEIKVTFNKGKRILGKVTSSNQVADFIRKQYKRGTLEAQEYFNVLYLNRSNSIIGYYRHSKGGITGTVADLRMVFAVALKSFASGIILSHNHPSGSLQPSMADMKLTKKCQEVAALHEINLLDHIIVSKQGYYSFADHNKL